MTARKTIALTIWTFVSKVMYLLFNTLSRSVRTSLMAQTVKRLPTMRETWVQSLGWEDLLEKEMATHSSIVAWRISMDREAWRATVHRVPKSWT